MLKKMSTKDIVMTDDQATISLFELNKVIAEQNDAIAALQEELAEWRAQNGLNNKTIPYDDDDVNMNLDEEQEEEKSMIPKKWIWTTIM